jgi:hypothetical protein
MLQPVIENTYLVEVNLGTVATQKRINFQFVPQLEGCEIYAIQSFSASDLAASPNGSTVVSTAGLAACSVTFVIGDDEKIYTLPISDLRSANIYGFQRMFKNLKINLTKSYITIQTTTGVNNNESVLVNFIYRPKK